MDDLKNKYSRQASSAFISINNSLQIERRGYSPVVKPEKEGKIEIKYTTGAQQTQRSEEIMLQATCRPLPLRAALAPCQKP